MFLLLFISTILSVKIISSLSAVKKKSEAEVAVSYKKFADIAANYTVVNKKLVGLVSERGTSRIIENIYAAILSELKRTGQYENFDDLSSLLKSKLIDETTKRAAITNALSTISGFPLAGRYWHTLHETKVTRNKRQHAELRNQEEAFEIVDDFVKPTSKRAWPPSPTSDLKKILYKMIPLLYTSKHDEVF